ncbi:PspC domain-containing protein [Lachnospiraceae bacterium 54-53]
MYRKLYRSRDNRMILGLCGGIGEYFKIDPIIVRILFLISGIGIIAYFVICCFIPADPR